MRAPALCALWKRTRMGIQLIPQALPACSRTPTGCRHTSGATKPPLGDPSPRARVHQSVVLIVCTTLGRARTIGGSQLREPPHRPSVKNDTSNSSGQCSDSHHTGLLIHSAAITEKGAAVTIVINREKRCPGT